jgi:hypothetical protein
MRRSGRAISRRGWAFTVTLGVLLSSGCEERVVKHDPFLGGLPGAESQTPVVRNLSYNDPRRVSGSKIVVENPDRSKTLIARSGLHLMVHIYNCLLDDDKQLFVDQVLSERTKQEYVARSVDPGELFEELIRNFDDVETLFLLMPAGEYTPGVFLKSAGSRIQRLQASGAKGSSLRYKGIDMTMEGGNFRLVKFIGQKRPDGDKQALSPQESKSSGRTSPFAPSDSGINSITRKSNPNDPRE